MLYFLLWFLVGTFGDSYWDIQLTPQSIASVPFGPGHISVWEHATTPGRYYAMPLVYLLNKSARTRSNILTKVQEMSFDVLMWSEEAKEAVFRQLKAEKNEKVIQEHIEMLPMEKIRIVWRDRIRPIASEFKLIDHWKSNTDLPTTVTFQFICDSAENCNDLKTAMMTSPEMFNALELEYVINGQRAARRTLTVNGNHLNNGKLWTNLTNIPGDTKFLKSDDLKTIVSESVSNVIATLVTDSDYVDTGDEVNLNQVLQHVLERDEVSTDNFQPHQWESVFWNPAWARPDKLTKYLNNVLTKDTKDSKVFLLNENARSGSSEGKAGGNFLGIIKVSGGGGSSSSSQSKVQKEDVLNTLKERHSNIEFNGEIFRTKPMKLYRLNLSTLSRNTNIATANIQIRRYETVHTIKLRISDSRALTPSLTPQLVMERLNEKIVQTQTKISESVQKTNALSTKLDLTQKDFDRKLAPVNSKLSQLPGWPSGGYCLLARGGCPPGFSRNDGVMKQIPGRKLNPFAMLRGDIQIEAKFGDSKVKCDNNNHCNVLKGVVLVTCCK